MARGKMWSTTGFVLGVGVSVAANVAHTWHPTDAVLKHAHKTAQDWTPNLGSQMMAAFYPLALLITIEILARVNWPRTIGWSAARYLGASLVAAVAAVVSYRHMAGLLDAYGEDSLTSKIGPLSVDGLMVVASFALLAINQPTASAKPSGQARRPQRLARLLQRIRSFFVRSSNPVTWERPDDPTDTAPAPEKPGVHPVDWGWLEDADSELWPQPEDTDSVHGKDSSNGGTDGEPGAVPEGVPDPDPVYLLAETEFAEDLNNGDVPGIRRIKSALKCGQPKAEQVRAYLLDLARTRTQVHPVPEPVATTQAARS